MRRLLFGFALLASPLGVYADTYAAAVRHGIDPLLFRAIAHVESNGHPWTLNIDGEPLRFQKKSDLVAYYRHVKSRPIMLKTVRDGIYRHQWYASALDAEADYFNARHEDTRLRLPKDRWAVLRVVNTENVDIGAMQINWIHNGRRSGMHFEKLVDPNVNAEYAARILAGLIRQHGLWSGVGRYHSGTPWRQQAYTSKVYRAYRGFLGDATRQSRISSDPSS